MPRHAFWRGFPGGGDGKLAGKMMEREATSAVVKGEEARLQKHPRVGLCWGLCLPTPEKWLPCIFSQSCWQALQPEKRVLCAGRQQRPLRQQRDELEPVATSALQGRAQPNPPPPTLAGPPALGPPAAPALGAHSGRPPRPAPVLQQAGQGEAGCAPGPL